MYTDLATTMHMGVPHETEGMYHGMNTKMDMGVSSGSETEGEEEMDEASDGNATPSMLESDESEADVSEHMFVLENIEYPTDTRLTALTDRLDNMDMSDNKDLDREKKKIMHLIEEFKDDEDYALFTSYAFDEERMNGGRQLDEDENLVYVDFLQEVNKAIDSFNGFLVL